MAARDPYGIGMSRYRQIRLTLTHETSGRVSVSLYAKGLNDAWSEHACIHRWSAELDCPIRSTEDAVEVAIWALQERPIPGL